MNNELLKKILTFVFSFAIWFVVGAAILIIYFFYNQELFEKFFKFLAPVFVYASGIVFFVWFRKKKKNDLERGGGSLEKSIYVTQWDLLKHDLLMFGVPLVILVLSWFIKDTVSGFDIFISGVVFVGFYLSELIYKKKL